MTIPRQANAFHALRRRESLDHLVVFGERPLRHVLRSGAFVRFRSSADRITITSGSDFTTATGSSCAALVPAVLQRHPNTSVTGQASHRSEIRRCHWEHSSTDPWRIASPLCPDLICDMDRTTKPVRSGTRLARCSAHPPLRATFSPLLRASRCAGRINAAATSAASSCGVCCAQFESHAAQ